MAVNLRSLKLLLCQTFRVLTLILTRNGVKYLNSGWDNAIPETLKVFSAQGGNLGHDIKTDLTFWVRSVMVNGLGKKSMLSFRMP